MGKGDRRSRRGKLFLGTYGKKRPRKKKNGQSKKNKTKKP
jgi:30S ribosomal protein S31